MNIVPYISGLLRYPALFLPAEHPNILQEDTVRSSLVNPVRQRLSKPIKLRISLLEVLDLHRIQLTSLGQLFKFIRFSRTGATFGHPLNFQSFGRALPWATPVRSFAWAIHSIGSIGHWLFLSSLPSLRRGILTFPSAKIIIVPIPIISIDPPGPAPMHWHMYGRPWQLLPINPQIFFFHDQLWLILVHPAVPFLPMELDFFCLHGFHVSDLLCDGVYFIQPDMAVA